MSKPMDYELTQKPFFPKTLYSNKELLKTNQWSIAKMILIFIVNVSLICAPFFLSRTKTKPIDVLDYMPNIEVAFQEFYELELPCSINKLELTCEIAIDQSYVLTDYTLYILPTDLASINPNTSRIVMTNNHIGLYYIDALDEKDNYNIESSYRLLEEMDFSKINREDLQLEMLEEEAFYKYITETILLGILNGNLPSDLATIYLAQLVQTSLYVLIMSVMLMAANLRRQVKKIYYSSSLKYTIFAITGPALIAAIIGLFSTIIGTIVWSAIYAVRIILLYTKINNTDGTF